MRQFWNFMVSFEGRFSREDYWLGYGCQLSFFVLASSVLATLKGAKGMGEQVTGGMIGLGLLVFCFVSWIATHVKRWHDLGQTGWSQLIMLVPIAGPLYTLWFCGCVRGQDGFNIYGADPLQEFHSGRERSL